MDSGWWIVVGADGDRAAELRAPGRSGRMKPEDTEMAATTTLTRCAGTRWLEPKSYSRGCRR